MRVLLLSLALLYAVQAPGICICHLSERLAELFAGSDASPCPDDDDEGDCPCAKKLFMVQPPVTADPPVWTALLATPLTILGQPTASLTAESLALPGDDGPPL